ncbi:MAG: coagulation factor 5/8 type domain protein [Paenibacillus sp.]|nr:coagulation factor 5/8 type domain protein [Paenibacillus sp.]
MNSAIAAVDRYGNVTGISQGFVQIKAASIDDPTKFALFDVTVQSEISSHKEITLFSIEDAAGAINGTDILVNIPEGIDTSSLVASFNTTGKKASINGVPQISGMTPNDFTSPVVYTVTAADLTEKQYKVTVNKVSNKKDLIKFSLVNPSAEGKISSFLAARTIVPLNNGYYSITEHRDNSVALVVPDGSDLSSLTAAFETNGSKVYVNEVEQTSGVSVNDFSSPVIYRVMAQDGTYKDYIVTVYKNPADAVVTPYNEVTGKSMKYVAYSSQVLNPGDNLTAWYRYSNVNGARYWIAPKAFISDNVLVNGNYANINSDPTIQTVGDFDQRKVDLRQKMLANPEDSTYLNWPNIKTLMAQNIDFANSQSVDDAMRRLKENNIDPIVEMHFTDVAYTTEREKWQKSWQTWQMIYATVFYLSKHYGIYMFEGPNEPEQGIKEIADAATPQEREEAVQKLQLLLKIYSDAIRSAVNDANTINHNHLMPIFAAPTTSTANNDITKATLRGNRTDYHGTTVDFNIVDYFVKHLYTYRVNAFENDFEVLKQMMREHTPNGQLLPIIYTEFNYSGYANMKDMDMTFDDPDVIQAEASTWQSSMENGMYGMYQFKYAEKYNGQNRNFMHYQFDKPRDPAKNIALNKPVTTDSSDSTNIDKVVDGNAADGSAWISGSSTSHSFVIDLQSSQPIRFFAIDLGDAYYSTNLRAYTNIYGNFKLEYSEDQSSWTEIPESVVASNSVNTRSGNLESPITARYIKFTATTSKAQSIKVRDIFLSSDYGYFDIGGPLKSAEVTL